ncbi:hypothetical protein [Pseudomonas sp. Pseusp97]|uniref:hypothetical protein n=1 Tax=Pseudomonas sp. Pseusp97 TaxID=3243065 RepID=UPI0039A4C265
MPSASTTTPANLQRHSRRSDRSQQLFGFGGILLLVLFLGLYSLQVQREQIARMNLVYEKEMPGLLHLEAARASLAGIGHRTPALQGLVRFESACEDYQDQVQHVLAPNDQSLRPGKTATWAPLRCSPPPPAANSKALRKVDRTQARPRLTLASPGSTMLRASITKSPL